MRPERYSYSYAPASRRSSMGRVWPYVLILVAMLLLVLVRAEHPLVAQFRAQLLDVTSPITALASKPVSGVKTLVTDKKALLRAAEGNQQLRAENDTLRHWQAVAQALAAENNSLRALAGYQPVENVAYVTARVIGQSPTPYGGTLAVNVGERQGIGVLQPVIDAHGLVGRITELGTHNARILLLSDTLSRVPVISGNSRQHAILAGTGEELLRLTFTREDAGRIALGEPVVTTEEGGLMPGGILIGTVFRRDAEGLLVKPVRPLAESEYVRVIVERAASGTPNSVP